MYGNNDELCRDITMQIHQPGIVLLETENEEMFNVSVCTETALRQSVSNALEINALSFIH